MKSSKIASCNKDNLISFTECSEIIFRKKYMLSMLDSRGTNFIPLEVITIGNRKYYNKRQFNLWMQANIISGDYLVSLRSVKKHFKLNDYQMYCLIKTLNNVFGNERLTFVSHKEVYDE